MKFKKKPPRPQSDMLSPSRSGTIDSARSQENLNGTDTHLNTMTELAFRKELASVKNEAND